MDLVSVGLRLNTREEVHLFSFVGEGSFVNEGIFPDWLHWNEYLFDMKGTQERESRAFVELLCRMLGVSVQPPSS